MNAGTASTPAQSLLARVGLLKLIGQLLLPVRVGPTGAGELLGKAGQRGAHAVETPTLVAGKLPTVVQHAVPGGEVRLLLWG